MTLVKPRHPVSWAGALDRLIGRLGVAVCAELVGKSESLVRKWADPDCHELPSIEQAYLLDAGWMRAGVMGAPFCEVLGDRLAQVDAKKCPIPPPPLERLAEITREIGELAAAVLHAQADRQLSLRERANIGREANEAIDTLRRLISDMGTQA